MSVRSGLINGKLPGQKGSDWPLLYVELYEDSLHIFEGNEDPMKPRRQMRSLEINSTDITCNKDRDKKRDYRFQYERFDGKYIFKCTTAEERASWVSDLSKMIQRKLYVEKGMLQDSFAQYSLSSRSPSASTRHDSSTSPHSRKSMTLTSSRTLDMDTPPPPPRHKRDSGFVSGTGDARSYRGTANTFSGDSVISHGKSNSGDSTIIHTAVMVDRLNGCHSDDGRFIRSTNLQQPSSTTVLSVDENDLLRYDWYWGKMSRDSCTKELFEKGKVGNFVVRKNDRGDYVMSFWRKDTIHHHRILQVGDGFQFEKSVVQASGESIPDLLDTYMKCCTDKTIGPYGGQLYPNYDDPWNPPEIDFEKMSKHLKNVKEDGKRLFKPGPGMGEHTYGGLTLDQMNNVIENAIPFTNPAPSTTGSNPPTGQLQATPFAGITPDVLNKKTKKPPPTTPKPTKSPASSPTKKYVNLQPPVSTTEEFDDEDDEDDQEVYVNPGEVDQPVYENTVLGKDSTPSTTMPSPLDDSRAVYENFVVNPVPTASGKQRTPKQTSVNSAFNDSGLYQNVTVFGKPVTPPRQKFKRKS